MKALILVPKALLIGVEITRDIIPEIVTIAHIRSADLLHYFYYKELPENAKYLSTGKSRYIKRCCESLKCSRW